MTDAQKLTTLKGLLGITDTAQDVTLTAFLSFAKTELIAWRYGNTNRPPIARAVDSLGNYVSVSACMFIAAITPTNGTSYVFTYSEDAASWQYEIEEVSTDVELIDYGLSVTGTPVDGETITVKYTETPLSEYDTAMIQACVVGYGLQGAEGQTAHSENGINRTFKYSDMVDYLHRNVPAYVGIL
jgi:hypothetical protein